MLGRFVQSLHSLQLWSSVRSVSRSSSNSKASAFKREKSSVSDVSIQMVQRWVPNIICCRSQTNMQCLQCTDHFSVLRIIIRISDNLPRLVRNPAPDQLCRWLLNQMPRASNYQLSGALLQSTRQLMHEEEREEGAGEEEAARKERRKRRQLEQNDGQAVQHYQRSAAWPH